MSRSLVNKAEPTTRPQVHTTQYDHGLRDIDRSGAADLIPTTVKMSPKDGKLDAQSWRVCPQHGSIS
jgi:hypothetical protein